LAKRRGREPPHRHHGRKVTWVTKPSGTFGKAPEIKVDNDSRIYNSVFELSKAKVRDAKKG